MLIVAVAGWVVRDTLGIGTTTTLQTSGSTDSTGQRLTDAAPRGTPPPVPVGTGEHRFLQLQGDGTGRPIAFDPCRRIHYVVRRAAAPEGADAVVRKGLRELARVTGLDLVDDGATTEAPRDDRGRRELVPGDEAPPVLIAWSDEKESPDLAGYIAGFGGPSGVHGRGDGGWFYTSGQVVLDRDAFAAMLADAEGRRAARAVVLHELGHLVGLAHVADTTQIMYSESTTGVTEYGHGDLTGLSALGRGDCFRT